MRMCYCGFTEPEHPRDPLHCDRWRPRTGPGAQCFGARSYQCRGQPLATVNPGRGWAYRLCHDHGEAWKVLHPHLTVVFDHVIHVTPRLIIAREADPYAVVRVGDTIRIELTWWEKLRNLLRAVWGDGWGAVWASASWRGRYTVEMVTDETCIVLTEPVVI